MYSPKDPDFESRVRASFARQTALSTIGATMRGMAPGEVEITLPYSPNLTQQHGFVHAGIIATIADSACGYAALSLMPADTSVLTVEFKVNLLAPARGTAFTARGRVLRPGRTITVCRADVVARADEGETLIATMLATMMGIRGREGILD